MTKSEAENQRQRVARVYARMSEDELRQLAKEVSSLTEIGKETLRLELARRGMKIELSEEHADSPDDIEFDKLVIVQRFRDLPEALLAKGTLESAGIECFLRDDIVIRMDWFISNALGGIKLCVGKEDAEAASQLLGQRIPGQLDVAGVGEYQQPRCPRCDSLDISFEGLNKRVAYTTAFMGVPVPLSRRQWRCHTCGHEWRGSND